MVIVKSQNGAGRYCAEKILTDDKFNEELERPDPSRQEGRISSKGAGASRSPREAPVSRTLPETKTIARSWLGR